VVVDADAVTVQQPFNHILEAFFDSHPQKSVALAVQLIHLPRVVRHPSPQVGLGKNAVVWVLVGRRHGMPIGQRIDWCRCGVARSAKAIRVGASFKKQLGDAFPRVKGDVEALTHKMQGSQMHPSLLRRGIHHGLDSRILKENFDTSHISVQRLPHEDRQIIREQHRRVRLAGKQDGHDSHAPCKVEKVLGQMAMAVDADALFVDEPGHEGCTSQLDGRKEDGPPLTVQLVHAARVVACPLPHLVLPHLFKVQ